MRNYRSTIGGSFAAVGTLLWGMPVALSTAGIDFIPKSDMRWMVIIGIIMSIAGTFCAHLFSADAKQVANLKEQVQENSDALRTGDTTLMRKADGSQTK